jgi:mono/diheme cytochrome c family protein
MRFRSAFLVALCALSRAAFAQDAGASDDVQQGHRLALTICGYCHVAASDQRGSPILKPPAPSFVSIARRPTITADWLRTFLATTHGGEGAAKGMPNPELLDFQIRQVSAYLLSLRK